MAYQECADPRTLEELMTDYFKQSLSESPACTDVDSFNELYLRFLLSELGITLACDTPEQSLDYYRRLFYEQELGITIGCSTDLTVDELEETYLRNELGREQCDNLTLINLREEFYSENIS